MTVKLIACDLDGTLLRNDKCLSEYTVQVWNRCRERGIKLAIATNRSADAAQRAADLLQPDASILDGGALVKAGEDILYESRIPTALSKSLLLLCHEHPKVRTITVRTDGDSFVSYQQPPEHPDYANGTYYPFNVPLDRSPYKISLEITDAGSAAAIAEQFSQLDFSGFTGEIWYRVAMRGVDKAVGLEKLSGYYGVPLSHVAAFGDDDIDAGMLRLCGMGVAMANASEKTAACAAFHCRSNEEDGVAHWLEEYVLGTTVSVS